ncbi:MAG: DUF2721 domain-containing protein [Akkermansiaceae bacterium]|jgi:hypothetical protein|nr:DUF2721 domain-containing protein [Akkermansiaceae bacterium]
MQTHTVFEALQLAVSPAILISACGLLLMSMTNRLGRAIDRARNLFQESGASSESQIHILVRRARWIRSAILYNVISMFLTALLIPVLFISIFINTDAALFISFLLIASMTCLGISLVYFTVDIFSSLRAMEEGLVDRKVIQ